MNEPILPQIVPITNPRVKDLTRQRFGRLTVVGYVGSSPSKQARWLCQCDCGETKTVASQCLIDGKTSSCGCFQRENTSVIHKKHGMKDTAEYRAWKAMRTRCNNPNIKEYKDYGGRGIKICDRWQSFENFYADMGQKPTPQHSLDRIDANGNYEPSNCRWATREEQSNNTRSNRLVTFDGKTQNLKVWSKDSGIAWSTLYKRIFVSNWTIEDALTMPLQP